MFVSGHFGYFPEINMPKTFGKIRHTLYVIDIVDGGTDAENTFGVGSHDVGL